MSLSCDCNFGDDAEWYYEEPFNYSKLDRKRATRCCSCEQLIKPNSDCGEFTRCRDTQTDIEINIYDDLVPLASWFMCADCTGIWLNLSALGYCMDINQPVSNALSEYHEMTGFKKEKQ